MTKKPKGLLVRVAKKERIESLVNEGHLYMNTIKYFRDVKDKDPDLRGDPSEGRGERIVGKLLHCNIWNKKTKEKLLGISDGFGKLEMGNPQLDQTNIACFTFITSADLQKKGSIQLSQKFLKFGQSAMVIPYIHYPIFFERLKLAISQRADIKRAQSDCVSYEKPNYSGQWGIFRKDYRYAWQYEWRLAITQTSNPGGPFKDFKIGSLNDIAQIITTEELIKPFIKFRN